MLDQTVHASTLEDGVKGSNEQTDHDAGASKATDSETSEVDRDAVFAEERDGWRGYIEWENYPEKKQIANKIMKSIKFPDPPEFQLAPVRVNRLL